LYTERTEAQDIEYNPRTRRDTENMRDDTSVQFLVAVVQKCVSVQEIIIAERQDSHRQKIEPCHGGKSKPSACSINSLKLLQYLTLNVPLNALRVLRTSSEHVWKRP